MLVKLNHFQILHHKNLFCKLWVFFLSPSWNRMHYISHVTLSEILLFMCCHNLLYTVKNCPFRLMAIWSICNLLNITFLFAKICPHWGGVVSDQMSPILFVKRLIHSSVLFGSTTRKFFSFAGFKNFGDVQHLEIFCPVGLCAVMRVKFSK